MLLFSGCAYFNTYYNAQNYYKEGVRLKEQNQAGQAKGKFEKSIEKSALVISRWPTSRWVDDATFLIGRSYYEMGQHGKAVSYFERLKLAFPGSGFVAEAELYRGLALLEDGEYGDARVVLDRVREEHPRFRDDAAFHLAASFYEREDYERAVDSLQAFVETYPRSKHTSAAVLYLAESNFELERWAEATEWYQRLARLRTGPKERVQAMLRVAACQLEGGECEDAARQVREVLGRYTEFDDEANLLLGKAYSEMGRYEDAIATWAKVRGNSDFGAEAFFRIGKHHEELKDFELARAHYDTAKSRRANSDYGVLAVKRLSLLDAFASGDSAAREPAEALFLLAEVHNLNLGEYDEAMELYRQVYDSFPDSEWAPKAQFARAWILRNVEGDSTGMRSVLDRIIAEYPDTDYADESRRWLGMPVPERVKEPEPAPPDTVATEPGRPEPPPEPEPPAPDTIAGDIEPPEPPGELPPEPGPAGDTVASDTAAVELRTVYFDTDRSDIRQGDAEKLRGNVRYLAANPDQSLLLVGHCDPRGDSAYNTALGMRRARAVREFLVEAGVDAGRLFAESEGENRTVSGSPGEYWKDRRVEFLVR